MKFEKSVLSVLVAAGLVVAAGGAHAADMYVGAGLAAGNGRATQQVEIGDELASTIIGEHGLSGSLALDARLIGGNNQHGNAGNVGITAVLNGAYESVSPYVRVSRGATGNGMGFGVLHEMQPLGQKVVIAAEVAGYSSIDGKAAGQASITISRHF